MKPVTVSVFLLSFLFSIDAALRCYQCHERNLDTCKEKAMDCPEGDQCLTISEKYIHNDTYQSVYKGCSRGLPCNTTAYSKATNEANLRFNIKCCEEDLCNKKFYEMPEVPKPNGGLCPSCYTPDILEECQDGGNKTRCQDINDKCFKFAGMVEKPDGMNIIYGLKGCASPMICQSELSQLVEVKVVNATIFGCTVSQPVSEEDKE